MEYRFTPPAVLAMVLVIVSLGVIVTVIAAENSAVVNSASMVYHAYMTSKPPGPVVVDVTIPRSSFAYNDAVIITVLLITGVAMFFASRELRSPVVTLSGGAILSVESIGAMVARSTIVTAYNVSENGIQFIYEPNPMTRIYLAPLLLGLLLLGLGIAELLRRTANVRRPKRMVLVE